jgi:uncharacterized RDD family membrane protein YckC
MSDYRSGAWTNPQPGYGTAAGIPPALLEGVRTRRIFALVFDLIFLTLLVTAIFVLLSVLGLLTFGVTWLLIPLLFTGVPIIALFYNGVSVSGWRMSTPGMRLMDLEMRTMAGTRVPFLIAAAHALFLYLSVYFLTPFILLVSLFTNEKRCLHDLLAGVVVTRRV